MLNYYFLPHLAAPMAKWERGNLDLLQSLKYGSNSDIKYCNSVRNMMKTGMSFYTTFSAIILICHQTNVLAYKTGHL